MNKFNSNEEYLEYFKGLIIKYKTLTLKNIIDAANEYLFFLQYIYFSEELLFDLGSLRKIENLFTQKKLSHEEKYFFNMILGLFLGQTIVENLDGHWVKVYNIGTDNEEFAVSFGDEHNPVIFFPFVKVCKFLYVDHEDNSLVSAFIALVSYIRLGVGKFLN